QAVPNEYAGRIISNRAFLAGYGLGLLNDGRVRFTAFAVEDYDSSAVVPFDNAYHYVVVTFDQNFTAKFYVDGVLVDTIQGSQGANSSDLPLEIGFEPYGGTGEYFTGDIGQVAVYSHVLSAATILDHYEAGIEPSA